MKWRFWVLLTSILWRVSQTSSVLRKWHCKHSWFSFHFTLLYKSHGFAFYTYTDDLQSKLLWHVEDLCIDSYFSSFSSINCWKDCLHTFVKYQLALFVRFYFCSFPLLHWSFLSLIRYCLSYWCCSVSLEIGLFESPNFPWYSMTILGFLPLLWNSESICLYPQKY